MRNRPTQTITPDPETWKAFVAQCRARGITPSRFLDILMQRQIAVWMAELDASPLPSDPDAEGATP